MQIPCHRPPSRAGGRGSALILIAQVTCQTRARPGRGFSDIPNRCRNHLPQYSKRIHSEHVRASLGQCRFLVSFVRFLDRLFSVLKLFKPIESMQTCHTPPKRAGGKGFAFSQASSRFLKLLKQVRSFHTSPLNGLVRGDLH